MEDVSTFLSIHWYFISGKSQVFVNREWKDISQAESFKITKVEGQVR